jgi:hypothetical protein
VPTSHRSGVLPDLEQTFSGVRRCFYTRNSKGWHTKPKPFPRGSLQDLLTSISGHHQNLPIIFGLFGFQYRLGTSKHSGCPMSLLIPNTPPLANLTFAASDPVQIFQFARQGALVP